MAYGSIKVDTIVFTNNSADQSVSISGIIASTSGNLTVTGTISGSTVQATYGTFTSLTGVTTSGTNANFQTITGATGVFTTSISGATVIAPTGTFTSLTGTTATFTSGIIASGTAALPSLAILSDPNTGIFSPGADQLAVATNGTEKLIVKSSGEIGIGTSVPNYQLHATTSFAVGAAGFNQQLSFTNDTIQSLILGTGYTPLKLNPLGGNVGIGTTSPGALLDVTGSNGKMLIANGTVSNSMRLSAQNATGTGNAAMVFESYNLEYGRFDSSGRLLVGTSSDLTGALLQVNGAMNSNKYQQNVTTGSTDTIFTMAASQCYHIYATEGTNQTHSVAIASCAEGSSTAVLTSLYQSSANTVLSASGLNIQIYNGAGSTRTIKTTILRMV